MSVAVVASHVLAVVQAAVTTQAAAAAPPAAEPVPLSMYYVAHAVREHYRGMLIAVAAAVWAADDRQRPAHLARTLRYIAAHVRLDAFRKHPRGPTRVRKKGYAPAKTSNATSPPLACSSKRGNGSHLEGGGPYGADYARR